MWPGVYDVFGCDSRKLGHQRANLQNTTVLTVAYPGVKFRTVTPDLESRPLRSSASPRGRELEGSGTQAKRHLPFASYINIIVT